MFTHPLKSVLRDRGLTQRAAAAALEVNPNSFNRVLNGHEPPWPALRRRASMLFGLPEDQLFDKSPAATLLKQSRAAQGLPENITDAEALDAIAAIVRRRESRAG